MSDALLAGSPESRLKAIAALGASDEKPGPAELAALRDCLADPHKLIQRRAAETFAVLSRRGIDVRNLLLAALRQGDLSLRWGAAYALSLIRALTREALPTLL